MYSNSRERPPADFVFPRNKLLFEDFSPSLLSPRDQAFRMRIIQERLRSLEMGRQTSLSKPEIIKKSLLYGLDLTGPNSEELTVLKKQWEQKFSKHMSILQDQLAINLEDLGYYC